jgi:hypothetical protein
VEVSMGRQHDHEELTFRLRVDWIVCGILVSAGLFGAGYLVYAIRNSNERTRANTFVADRITEATALANAGQFDDALRVIVEAVQKANATNTDAAREIQEQINNQRNKLVAVTKLASVRSLAVAGKFAEATVVLEEYGKLPEQTEKEYSQQLLSVCRAISSIDTAIKFMGSLSDQDFDSLSNSKVPPSLALLVDASGDLALQRLRSNLEPARARRQQVKEFKKWIASRTFEDSSTRAIFDGYFVGLMRMLDEELGTSQRELIQVRQAFDKQGFNTFAGYYIAILEEVYNVDNYKTDRETEVTRLLREQRNVIVRSIIAAVAAEKPPR